MSIDINKQAKIASWVQSVKEAADFLNEKLAEMPEDADLEVEVSANEQRVPEQAAKEAVGGKVASSLRDIRGLNADTCWQVNVEIKQVTKL